MIACTYAFQHTHTHTHTHNHRHTHTHNPDDFANFLAHPLLQRAQLPCGLITFQRKSKVEAGRSRVLFAAEWNNDVVRFALFQGDGSRRAVVKALGESRVLMKPTPVCSTAMRWARD